MRRKALFSTLSEKLRQKRVLLLDSLKLESAKTKELAKIFDGLPSDKKSTLLVLPSMETNVIRAARNIPYVKTVQARELSVLHVISCTYVVLPRESLSILEKTFLH